MWYACGSRLRHKRRIRSVRRRALFGHDLISIVVFFMDLALARPVLDLVLNSLTVALLRSVVVCSQFVQTERLASIASTRSPGLCRPISYAMVGGR